MKLLAFVISFSICFAQSPQAANTTSQSSQGVCSPNVANVKGNVTIHCNDIPDEVIELIVTKVSYRVRDLFNAGWYASGLIGSTPVIGAAGLFSFGTDSQLKPAGVELYGTRTGGLLKVSDESPFSPGSAISTTK